MTAATRRRGRIARLEDAINLVPARHVPNLLAHVLAYTAACVPDDEWDDAIASALTEYGTDK